MFYYIVCVFSVINTWSCGRYWCQFCYVNQLRSFQKPKSLKPVVSRKASFLDPVVKQFTVRLHNFKMKFSHFLKP